ncbi:hypothetical protein C942_01125 [Photobacterium marinum]|uniref:Uncharacterized protein n=1 Tax=Photobacterium marinum TaxID=1056511 RepID=L8JAU4_9GAMM|nr:hypothetical protein C942_01125 [Photobacterium marinum]
MAKKPDVPFDNNKRQNIPVEKKYIAHCFISSSINSPLLP